MFAEKLNNNMRVTNVRVLGVILAFEIKRDAAEEYYGNFRNRLYKYFIENGIILRPVGNTVYILPPYIITDDLLRNIYDTIEEAIDKIL